MDKQYWLLTHYFDKSFVLIVESEVILPALISYVSPDPRVECQCERPSVEFCRASLLISQSIDTVYESIEWGSSFFLERAWIGSPDPFSRPRLQEWHRNGFRIGKFNKDLILENKPALCWRTSLRLYNQISIKFHSVENTPELFPMYHFCHGRDHVAVDEPNLALATRLLLRVFPRFPTKQAKLFGGETKDCAIFMANRSEYSLLDVIQGHNAIPVKSVIIDPYEFSSKTLKVLWYKVRGPSICN